MRDHETELTDQADDQRAAIAAAELTDQADQRAAIAAAELEHQVGGAQQDDVDSVRPA